MSLLEKLEKQEKEHEEEIKKLNKVKELINVFPDLEEDTNRWGKKFLVSSKVNPIVTNVDFGHSCGCCADSPLLAYFYIIYDGIKIYANPFEICIGEQNAYGYGEKVKSNWKDILRNHNINSNVYPLVQKFIDENPCENYEEDEE